MEIEIAYIAVAILQSIAVSLGVGSSTIAITQFFSAIADGNIDETERRMMGVVYFVLRIAMVSIALTSLVQAGIIYKFIGAEYLNPFTIGLWVIIAVLFINAVLMTKRLMPSKFGPGIQAGSWYSLGILFSIVPLGLTNFTNVQFALAYAGIVVLTIAIVNGVMSYRKSH